MKRLTAILLVIALIISACAAPAGAGGSESGEPGSQTEESSLLGEEGFVPAEEPKEEAAEEPAAEELHEVSEESDDSEPDIIESDTMQETEESKPRLVKCRRPQNFRYRQEDFSAACRDEWKRRFEYQRQNRRQNCGKTGQRLHCHGVYCGIEPGEPARSRDK